MARVISAKFFATDAATVARGLLGTLLCVRIKGKTIKLPIIETEAYIGPHDRASHAARGKTARTEVMYRRAGIMYVYLIYGVYEMFNIVTGAPGYPAAVLIRCVEGYAGPGKLTKALRISRKHNGKPLGIRTGIWIERQSAPQRFRVERAARIGVEYAGRWAHRKLRFIAQKSR